MVSFAGEDPLADFYAIGLALYLLVAFVLLSWPFEFAFIAPANNAAFLSKGNGVEFSKPGQIWSREPAHPLYRKLLAGSGLSLETWLASYSTDQTGPARILSYSPDTTQRNFTLGQDGKNLLMRLRTSETDLNGIDSQLQVEGVFSDLQPLHIVVSYDHAGQRVYVNGALAKTAALPGGDFSNWNPGFPLVLGNEASGDRPWLGVLYSVAIYNRALNPDEIKHHFARGVPGNADFSTEDGVISAGPVARYLFEKNDAGTVVDSSKQPERLDLYLTDRIGLGREPLLALNAPSLENSPESHSRKVIAEAVLNVQAFIPLGILLCGWLGTLGISLRGRLSLAIALGACFSTGIESLQYYLPARSSSGIDVINNTLGTSIGAVLYLAWHYRLLTRRKRLLRSLS